MERVKLFSHPGNPTVEVAEGLVLKMGLTHSSDKTTVVVNPNIQEYQANADQPGIQVRQVMVTTSTADTRELEFNFRDKVKQIVEIDGQKYELKLESIGSESVAEFGAHKFPYSEFLVTKI